MSTVIYLKYFSVKIFAFVINFMYNFNSIKLGR